MCIINTFFILPPHRCHEIMHTITMDIVFGEVLLLFCALDHPYNRQSEKQSDKSNLLSMGYAIQWYPRKYFSPLDIDMYQMPLETLLCFYYHAFNPNPNATSKSKLVIERQRAKNKATQLHSVVLDSILRFDTPIQYSDSILRVGGGCMSIVRSAITICSTIRR